MNGSPPLGPASYSSGPTPSPGSYPHQLPHPHRMYGRSPGPDMAGRNGTYGAAEQAPHHMGGLSHSQQHHHHRPPHPMDHPPSNYHHPEWAAQEHHWRAQQHDQHRLPPPPPPTHHPYHADPAEMYGRAATPAASSNGRGERGHSRTHSREAFLPPPLPPMMGVERQSPGMRYEPLKGQTAGPGTNGSYHPPPSPNREWGGPPSQAHHKRKRSEGHDQYGPIERAAWDHHGRQTAPPYPGEYPIDHAEARWRQSMHDQEREAEEEARRYHYHYQQQQQQQHEQRYHNQNRPGPGKQERIQYEEATQGSQHRRTASTETKKQRKAPPASPSSTKHNAAPLPEVVRKGRTDGSKDDIPGSREHRKQQSRSSVVPAPPRHRLSGDEVMGPPPPRHHQQTLQQPAVPYPPFGQEPHADAYEAEMAARAQGQQAQPGYQNGYGPETLHARRASAASTENRSGKGDGYSDVVAQPQPPVAGVQQIRVTATTTAQIAAPLRQEEPAGPSYPPSPVIHRHRIISDGVWQWLDEFQQEQGDAMGHFAESFVYEAWRQPLLPMRMLSANVGALLEVRVPGRELGLYREASDRSSAEGWSLGWRARQQGCKVDVESKPIEAKDVESQSTDFWSHRGVAERKLWGSEVYTDDSDVLAMCVHGGWIEPPLKQQNAASQNERQGSPSIQKTRSSVTHPLYAAPDIRVLLRIAPRLVGYRESYGGGIWSRNWLGMHDGVSLVVENVELRKAGWATSQSLPGARGVKSRVQTSNRAGSMLRSRILIDELTSVDEDAKGSKSEAEVAGKGADKSLSILLTGKKRSVFPLSELRGSQTSSNAAQASKDGGDQSREWYRLSQVFEAAGRSKPHLVSSKA